MAAEQQVNLTDLEPIQLQEVKKQLDSELEHLTSSYSQLKQAQAKFKSCLNDLGEVGPSVKGKQVLVPLTSSLYVPGRLSDTETVVVDIGTGYYVKKSHWAHGNWAADGPIVAYDSWKGTGKGDEGSETGRRASCARLQQDEGCRKDGGQVTAAICLERTRLEDRELGVEARRTLFTFTPEHAVRGASKPDPAGILTNQTRAEAKAHYTQKSNFVQGNLDTLQKTIERKNENVQMVVQVLQMKMQQGGGGGGSGPGAGPSQATAA